MNKASDFIGKRLLAIDYGRKRIGIAVCDELHITVSSRDLQQHDNSPLISKINNLAQRERVAAIIVGVPFRHDEETTPLIEEIEQFIKDAAEITCLPIIPFDESFSSKRAMQAMISSGIKKKQRAQKGNTDSAAAVIILRDFLQSL